MDFRACVVFAFSELIGPHFMPKNSERVNGPSLSIVTL